MFKMKAVSFSLCREELVIRYDKNHRSKSILTENIRLQNVDKSKENVDN